MHEYLIRLWSAYEPRLQHKLCTMAHQTQWCARNKQWIIFDFYQGLPNICVFYKSIRMPIGTIGTRFGPFEWELNHSKTNSNHSNGIQNIRMQIQTIRARFEPFESNFNHSNGIQSIGTGFETFECKFQPFEQGWKHSNANSNGIWSTWMQIPPF